MFKQILLCSDGSDHALRAAEVAAEMARRFNARVTLLNVYTPANYLMPVSPESGLLYAGDDLEAERIQDAVETRTGKALQSAGVEFDARRETGHAVESIVRVATEVGADLIVMGSRGLGGFKRFVLGSVSDGVLHHAHCPVLIVR